MTRRIPLLRGGEVVAHALVDAEDYERLAQFRWRHGYWGHAERSRNGRNHPMHREVVGLVPGEGKVVHHINEDPLDNRRENLLVCADHSEHLRQPHPKTDARRLAAMHAHVAANPGWPHHHLSRSRAAA